MNKKFVIFTSIGFVFLFCAFALFLKNKYEDKYAGIKSHDTYLKIQEELNKDKREEITQIENIEMKKLNIDGNDYIGTINIPTLGLELPIMEDWDYDKMKISPCRYYGTIYTNDLVICAHAYESMFANIKKLKRGDKVIITDMNKNKYIYEVILLEVLSPYNVKEMIESEFDLTLYTCTYDNLNRVTVRLNRIF